MEMISELSSRKSTGRRGVCVCGWEGFEINVAVVLINGDAKLAGLIFFFFCGNCGCGGRIVPAVVVGSVPGPCIYTVEQKSADAFSVF